MGERATGEARYAMTDKDHPARVRLFGKAQGEGAFKLRDSLQRSVVAFDWIELHDDTDSANSGSPSLRTRGFLSSRCPTVGSFMRPQCGSWLTGSAGSRSRVYASMISDLRGAGSRGPVGSRLRGV